MILKNIQKLLILLILFFNSSCITGYMWGGTTYREPISQFLIGQNGRYVVLVGNDYHYVLIDDSKIFSQILRLKQRNILTINSKKSKLSLADNNELSGHLTIKGPFSVLPLSDAALLTSLGFRPDDDDEVTIKIKLDGRRYAARYLGGQNLTKSNNTFMLPVTYYNSGFTKNIGKAAITPVTVGLDAVILIGKAIVYPFSL